MATEFHHASGRRYVPYHAIPGEDDETSGSNISAPQRLASVALGAALAAYGLRKRSLPGLLMGTAGAFLVTRGARGHSAANGRLGMSGSRGPVELIRSVTINRSRDQVYGFWRQMENLPRFMRHVKEITAIGPNRYRWSIHPAVPMAPRIQWDTEITEDQPDSVIAWRSLPDSPMATEGRVRFVQAPGGRGTEVHVQMAYRPNGGGTLARFTAPVTAQLLKEEIRRLKQILETGEEPATEGQPAARAA